MLKIGNYVSFLEREKVKKGRITLVDKTSADVFLPNGDYANKKLSSLTPLRGKPPSALRPQL